MVMSISAELYRSQMQLEALRSENSALKRRLELMSGVIEELMKAHEDRS
jgi:hypothetical protein